MDNGSPPAASQWSCFPVDLGIWNASGQWIVEEFVLVSIVDHLIDASNQSNLFSMVRV